MGCTFVAKFDDYSAVIVKSFNYNNLRANDYSAVILKSKRHKDMWRIGPLSVDPLCVRAPRALSAGRTVA
jgi:hypothetical protein